MRRTPKAEPKAFRFSKVENTVIQIPLPLNEIPGNSGKTIGSEFLMADGDVVQKLAAGGLPPTKLVSEAASEELRK